MSYISLLSDRPFVVVSGMSGSGKTTLVNALVTESFFKRPTSYTTRAKRAGESDNEYHFINKEYFLEMADSSRHFEYYDTVFQNYYAIDSKSITSIINYGFVPIKEVSLRNAIKIQSFNRCLVLSVNMIGKFEPRIDRCDEIHESIADDNLRFINIDINPRLSEKSDLVSYLEKWIKIISIFRRYFGEYIFGNLANEVSVNRAGYNLVAPYFTEDKRVTTKFFHFISLPFWDRVASYIKGDVLEIGPGHGWLRKNVSWDFSSYSGIDISEEMLNYNPDRNHISICTLQELNFKDNHYDAILGSLIDPCLSPTNLVHAYRLLKYGGYFCGTVPSLEWSKELRKDRSFSNTETIFSTPNGNARVSSYCFSKEQIEELLKVAGFKSIEVSPLDASSMHLDSMPPDIRSVCLNKGKYIPIIYGWRCVK